MFMLQHCSEKHKTVHLQNESWADVKSRDDVTVLVKRSGPSHLFIFCTSIDGIWGFSIGS